MPTASKFFSALLFAALAWFIADLYKPQLPEGTQTGLLSPVSALFGLVLGWRLMGRNAGRGLVPAVGYAITTSVAIMVWSLVFWAAYRMTIRSVRMFYDGPGTALKDFFALVAEYGLLLGKPDIAISVIVGSIFIGWLVEEVARRFS